MKKFIALAVLSVFTVLGANAQYRGRYDGGYQPVTPSRYTSRYRTPGHYWGWNRPYFGLRLGAAFSNISGDDFNNGNAKTGVNVGMAIGFPLSGYMPLYFETGLTYTEKGESYSSGEKYNLDYLELPFVFKYKCYLNNSDFAIEPYFGGYAAIGVAGKTRTPGLESTIYSNTHSSFGDEGSFRRGDAGIKLGCGFSYQMLYVDMTYDWGLANIVRESTHLDDAHNGTFMVNLGVNF